ncbi:hypothetical protein [Candidatus Palauibacter sp.]|uniref:hypothetical protein n=1 Tax=Candidatus Palauibacter sp. TaxID=3101350 RepID=UPI003B0169DA
MRPDIYFHVGAGRAASRWLQEQVFPRFRGVRYIPRNRFRQSAGIIATGGDLPVLVSRQLGYREFTPSVSWFARAAPTARPILVLRRHDGWLRSVYLREIKELRYVPFESFIDFERDAGVRPQASALFRERIRVLEEHFEHRPLVLFFDRLVANPQGFVRAIADYVGASYDETEIAFRPVNRSLATGNTGFCGRWAGAGRSRGGNAPSTPRAAGFGCGRDGSPGTSAWVSDAWRRSGS